MTINAFGRQGLVSDDSGSIFRFCFVAELAGDLAVLLAKLESRIEIVTKRQGRKRIRTLMATLAVGAPDPCELPLMGIRVAIRTRLSHCLAPCSARSGRLGQRLMARSASQRAMLAGQFESCECGMIKPMWQGAE